MSLTRVYEDIIELDDEIKELLEVELKEKLALSYDLGRHYGNMTTNLSEIYNNILKSVFGLPIMAIMQMTFFRKKKIFVERRANVEEFLERDVMWPPVVLTELTATAGASRSHFATLFDMRRDLF